MKTYSLPYGTLSIRRRSTIVLKIEYIPKLLFYSALAIAILILVLSFISDNEHRILNEVNSISSRILDLPIVSQDQKTDSDSEQESFRAFINNQDAEDKEIEDDHEVIYIDEDMLK